MLARKRLGTGGIHIHAGDDLVVGRLFLKTLGMQIGDAPGSNQDCFDPIYCVNIANKGYNRRPARRRS